MRGSVDCKTDVKLGARLGQSPPDCCPEKAIDRILKSWYEDIRNAVVKGVRSILLAVDIVRDLLPPPLIGIQIPVSGPVKIPSAQEPPKSVGGSREGEGDRGYGSLVRVSPSADRSLGFNVPSPKSAGGKLLSAGKNSL